MAISKKEGEREERKRERRRERAKYERSTAKYERSTAKYERSTTDPCIRRIPQSQIVNGVDRLVLNH